VIHLCEQFADLLVGRRIFLEPGLESTGYRVDDGEGSRDRKRYA